MINSTYMTEFTFQREWVEKRGLWLVLAFFFGGLGGGLYLVSLYLDLYVGLVTGFFIVVVGKGGAHLIFLGRPWRFWRGFVRWKTSWLARGLYAVAGFAVFGALQLAPTIPQLSWLPWTADNLAIQTLVIIAIVILISYTGFVLGVVKAIPFWSTALMPVIFIACSLLGGFGMAMALMSFGRASPIDVAFVENIVRWLLIIVALLLVMYTWISYQGVPASKNSVLSLLKGRVALPFVGGVVILGIILPLSIVVVAFFQEIPLSVLGIGAFGEFIGGFSLRYSILKAGVYAPLI